MIYFLHYLPDPEADGQQAALSARQGGTPSPPRKKRD
jgi:hypothetical protein